ncbi:MAG: HlyD family secretion protein [Pseudolabrys sp.]
MRKAIGIFVIVGALVLGACSKGGDDTLQGWVEADFIYVSSDEAGRVETLSVREGDRVAKGDALFSLDDDLQRSDVTVRQATVTNAKQAFERAENLLKTAAGTQKNFDDTQAGLRQAEANLAWAETRLKRRSLNSPVEGTVHQVYYRIGETVQATRAVVAILPPANLKIRFFAPQAELQKITIGDTVAVSCDGCESGLTATVSFIARNAEYTPPVIYSMEERAKLVFLIEAKPAKPVAFRVGQPVSVTLRRNGAVK